MPVLQGASQRKTVKRCQTFGQDLVDTADVAPGCQTSGENSPLAQRGLDVGPGSGFLQDPLLVLKLLLTLSHVLDARIWSAC